jgi:hypothetical protein
MIINVKIGPDTNCPDHAAMCRVIQEALTDHVRSREALVRHLRVQVTVFECSCKPGYASLGVTLDGQINGLSVDRNVRAARSPGDLHAAGGGAFGAGEIVKLLVVGLATNAFGVGADANNLSQCFTECMADLCLTIDELVGHKESVASRTWKTFAFARWIAACSLQGAFTIISAIRILMVPPFNFAALLGVAILGFILGFSSFWLVHVIGLVFMPKDFFLRDPRGKKALAQSGTNNILVLRGMCAVLAVVFTAVVAAFVVLFIALLAPTPQKAG